NGEARPPPGADTSGPTPPRKGHFDRRVLNPHRQDADFANDAAAPGPYGAIALERDVVRTTDGYARDNRKTLNSLRAEETPRLRSVPSLPIEVLSPEPHLTSSGPREAVVAGADLFDLVQTRQRHWRQPVEHRAV